jgi:hypothetical protein
MILKLRNIKKIRSRWIQTGAALVVLAALTADTRQPVSPPPGDVPAEFPRTAVSHEPAPGMVAVQMHDLHDEQLMGVRERIELPDRDGLMRQMTASSPGGPMSPTSMPAMPQPRRTDLDRGLRLEGTGGEPATDASGRSWGWLADEVNAAASPAVQGAQAGRLDFAPSSGSRLYQDSDNRLGTDRGFGSGGNDAFIFQRRRDEGF